MQLAPPETPQDTETGKIISFADYKDRPRKERRLISKEIQKGTFDPMRYLPIEYTKTVTELPSNQELVAAGYAPNSLVIRTKLTGRDELAISELSSLQKLNEATGEMESAVKPAELIVKIALMLISEWTFKDFVTGEAYPVNEDNLLSLVQEDFDYIALQINEVLTSLGGPAPQAAPVDEAAAEPAATVTEDQKN